MQAALAAQWEEIERLEGQGREERSNEALAAYVVAKVRQRRAQSVAIE